jgi:hypothetical protein
MFTIEKKIKVSTVIAKMIRNNCMQHVTPSNCEPISYKI